ncbi:type III PLP-dependent enzyme [Actinokineospora sp. 24-640]
MTAVDTPCYIYELDAVRTAHRQLSAALPEPSTLYYSLKANAHPAVLACLSALGCRAEVSSTGELTAALAAGFSAADVLYTGPGKRDQDIRFAVVRGVRLFSVDSPVALDQLDRLGSETGTGLRALLRVNHPEPPRGVGLAMTGGASKFGVDLAWVAAEPEAFADRPRAAVTGMHLYLGSNLGTTDALFGVFEHALGAAAQACGALRLDPAVLDLGGGFGAPYARPGPLPEFPDLAERLGELLDREVADWRAGTPRIAFESGRHLTASCGALVTTVLDVKRSGGTAFAILDSGTHHLGGIAGLGREDAVEPRVLAGKGADTEDWTLAGPLLHPLDVWARHARLPEPAVGDRITVPNVGAYGLGLGLVLFHHHPMPVEVVLDGGREVERTRLTVVRERL